MRGERSDGKKMDLNSLLVEPARRAGLETRALMALVRAGAIGVDLPHRLVQVLQALDTYGPFGAAPRIAAIRHGSYAAIADERGELTYADFDEAVDRIANALRQRLAPGDTIGILCRNHRGPLIVAFAASRAGVNAVWLNTAFSARQAAEVAGREGVDLLVHDVEFTDLVADIEARHGTFVVDIDSATDDLDALAAAASPTAPPAPAKPGKIILLTSGTTGTPKGAPRSEPRSFILPGGLLERLPMRAREATIIGPPLFHGTGLLIAIMTIALGSKLVLRRKFEAEQLLADIETHQATTVCVVPVMLQRVLGLGDDVVRGYDTSSLRAIFCAGSQLPAAVATAAQDLLGDVVYNLYGSTEVALATMATPADIREVPNSVGKPMLGCRIKIFDDNGRDVASPGTGRIFVGAATQFEGYTGGGTKEFIDGLMASGDVGHFDAKGRLYIDGRDDDMIVSGGENVFPVEVEELLATHPAIVEASAIGVDDEEFGKRLRAFVVTVSGTAVSEADLKQFVKDNLARYKVPREVVFLDELPRNPTGKVLKRDLAAWTD
ncbi:AMP-binding protein [Mycobacterium sp. CBMA293]|nr:AMP-binding protein [Mycolicibacterium sp. CBMA 360]MUL61843.1 AMP-binding protein [Mycolicibacterium sp. CBMA 335]MUL70907.1 AMP-binding protein [Mycolicibacterium sp. CBMA 311]MUL92867.1 AMP-binding protein [Mycolicibacterium sp. CBMA 230]MUM08691.1 acyl-CoA synthetase [Mycolicibacterium sp. CBMA 213]MUM14331.1 AMP-binding protein [Mycolicibacterium sp. CBMA 293]MUM32016.1 AMP-binding protein [Mycolicibacterium sp. CBMA 361]